MNWDVVAQSVVSGIAVSWPAVLIGYWVSHRKTRQHIDEVTRKQTRDITEEFRDSQDRVQQE